MESAADDPALSLLGNMTTASNAATSDRKTTLSSTGYYEKGDNMSTSADESLSQMDLNMASFNNPNNMSTG